MVEQISETGTVTATGIVNGFSETASVQIDVTCPMGDTTFDNHPQMREAMLNALGLLWQNADPNDPNTSHRKEQAGWLGLLSNGQYEFQAALNPSGNDACDSWPGSNAPGTPWGEIHVHPFGRGETTPPAAYCPGRANQMYASNPSGPDYASLLGEGMAQGLLMDRDNIYLYYSNGTHRTYHRYTGTCQII